MYPALDRIPAEYVDNVVALLDPQQVSSMSFGGDLVSIFSLTCSVFVKYRRKGLLLLRGSISFGFSVSHLRLFILQIQFKVAAKYITAEKVRLPHHRVSFLPRIP